MERLLEIIRRAAGDGALLLYTLADPTMAEATKHACQQLGVRSADILRPTSEVIAEHLGMSPSTTPRVDSHSTGKLTDNYSRLIHDAVEFTLMHDDGARTEDLNQAHIVLVGVSRTGKTPLSIYLSQKGYKVANVPMVTGMDLPRSLFEIDQHRIFGLTVSPTVLQQVRMERAKELGFLGSNYSMMDHVRGELEHARRIFGQNPSWPVIGMFSELLKNPSRDELIN
jgi:[pyruvate, phosphate dikinase]-phosphate phosphotransferase / [pyruvate, phosphate dikinase] kinase